MPALPSTFRRSAITNYLNTASSIVVALVTVPLLTSGLGPEAYGVWVLVGATVLYLELLEFGFGATTIRYVAAARGRGDDGEVRTAIATSFWVLCAPGALALVLGLGLAAGFPHLFEVDPGLVGATRVLLLLLAVDLALSIPGDCFGGTLIALQRYDLLNATLIAVSLSQAVAWAVVLAAGGGLVGLGVVTVVLSLLGQLARYLLVRRLVPGLVMHRRSASRALLRPYAGTSVWFSMSELSSVVVNRIDTIVVGVVVGVPAAGVYAVGQKLALLAERITKPALAVLFPHASELSAQGDAAGLRFAALTGTRIATGLGLPLALVLGLFAGPAVHVWVGPRFAGAATVLVYLAAASAVHAVAVAPKLLLYGGGGLRSVALVEAGEAVLNLVLSVALGLTLGAPGVALATLLSAAVTTAAGLVPVACRELGLQQRTLYAGVLRAHLLPALVAGGVGALLLRAGIDALLPLLGAVALTGLVYGGLLVLTGLDAGERRAVRARLGTLRAS